MPVLILCIVGALFIAGMFIVYVYAENEAQTEAKKQIADKDREFQQTLALESEQRRKMEAAAAAAQAAAAESQQLVVAAKQDAERARKEFAAGGQNLQELDESLRNGQVVFQRLGKVLTVRVFVVPPTGRTGLQWIAAWDRPYPPRVRIQFNDECSDTEHAFQGSWVRTLPRGATYRFQLSAQDDARPGLNGLVDSIDVSIQVPSPKQWARTVNPMPAALPPTDEQALSAKLAEYRKLTDAVVAGAITKGQCLRDAEAKLKASGLSEDAQAMILAKVEAWLAEQD